MYLVMCTLFLIKEVRNYLVGKCFMVFSTVSIYLGFYLYMPSAILLILHSV